MQVSSFGETASAASAYAVMMRNRPLVIAHRGASGYRPEHTASAYRLALQLGADAIEPDLVATRDGVLLIRHENELSGTTDIATRAEFADRRTTKTIDGIQVSGWFSEDFYWDELATLRAVERIPELRGASASFSGTEPLLRLTDLLELLETTPSSRGRMPILVAELKHATHFEKIGLRLDELLVAELQGRLDADRIVVESFELTVLDRLADSNLAGRRVFLVERDGKPADLVARYGAAAASYRDHVSDQGLARLAERVHGISVDARMLMTWDAAGNAMGPSDLVERAHAAGLQVFTWTLRPKNAFLPQQFQIGSDPAGWGNWREAYRLVIESGVDAVFADHPDLVLALLDS